MTKLPFPVSVTAVAVHLKTKQEVCEKLSFPETAPKIIHSPLLDTFRYCISFCIVISKELLRKNSPYVVIHHHAIFFCF